MKRGAFIKRLAGTFGFALTVPVDKLVGVEVEPVCERCAGLGLIHTVGARIKHGASINYLPDNGGGYQVIQIPCPACRPEDHAEAWNHLVPTASDHYEAYTRFCAEPFSPEFERARDEADAAIRKHIKEHLKAITAGVKGRGG